MPGSFGILGDMEYQKLEHHGLGVLAQAIWRLGKLGRPMTQATWLCSLDMMIITGNLEYCEDLRCGCIGVSPERPGGIASPSWVDTYGF